MEARDYVSALIERGWTQAQIAELTGIPQPTISKVVRGDIKDVMSQNYRKLQALHTDVLQRGDDAVKAALAPKVTQIAQAQPAA